MVTTIEADEKKKLPPRETSFSEWFAEILLRAKIVEKRIPDSSGFYGYPPWGTRIMKTMERFYEEELEQKKHEPIRSPTVISKTLLEIEKSHATGFSPEVWTITKARGGQPLNIEKVLRPTGETIIYPMFSQWIRSYTDLPLKTYETRSVFRAEPNKAVFPLFRTNEFYWIEAHDVQSSMNEAKAQIVEDNDTFRKVTTQILGIPYMQFQRPPWDTFAGAEFTYAYDAPLPDGRVLQIGTTHNLGQKFAKAFNIKFLPKPESADKTTGIKPIYAHQTCFGIGISRILGALVAIHGDNLGLQLPPSVAPIQIVIIPIYKKGADSQKIEEVAAKIYEELKSSFRVFLDLRKHTPGAKFFEWEEKGVPLRIEIGPRDIKKNQAVLVPRDHAEKLFIPLSELKNACNKALNDFFERLKKRAEQMFHITTTEDLDTLGKLLVKERVHLVKVPFCYKESCAEEINAQYAAKVRGIHIDFDENIDDAIKRSENEANGKKCLVCGDKAKYMVYVGRQY